MASSLITDLLKTPSQIRKENDQRLLTEGLAQAQLATQGNTLGGVGGMFANFGAQQAAQTGRNITNAFRGVTDAIGTATGADLRPADERAASAQQKAMAGLKMGNLQSMKAKRQELVNAGAPAAVIERLDNAIAKREAEVLQRSDTVQQRVQAQANADRDFGLRKKADARAETTAEQQDQINLLEISKLQRGEAKNTAITAMADKPWELSALGLDDTLVDSIANATDKTPYVPLIEKRLDEIAEVTSSSKDLTTAMRDYNFFKALPEEEQGAFLRMKRADPANKQINQGNKVTIVDSRTGRVIREFDVAVSPDKLPENVLSATVAAEQGRQLFADMGATEKEIKVWDDLYQSLDGIFTAPDLKQAMERTYGVASYLDAFTIRGGASADFQAKIEKLDSETFLAQFEKLKGGGQVTEAEGKKATEAINTLKNYKQSPEQAYQAMLDLRALIRDAQSQLQDKRDRASARIESALGAEGTGKTSVSIDYDKEGNPIQGEN